MNPKTLITAARHTAQDHPDFAAAVAFRALELILQGYGYDLTMIDVREGIKYLVYAAGATGQLTAMTRDLRAQAEEASSPYRTQVVDLLRRVGCGETL